MNLTNKCHLSPVHAIALMSTNSLTAVLGTFGNLLVCIAVITIPRLRKNFQLPPFQFSSCWFDCHCGLRTLACDDDWQVSIRSRVSNESGTCLLQYWQSVFYLVNSTPCSYQRWSFPCSCLSFATQQDNEDIWFENHAGGCLGHCYFVYGHSGSGRNINSCLCFIRFKLSHHHCVVRFDFHISDERKREKEILKRNRIQTGCDHFQCREAGRFHFGDCYPCLQCLLVSADYNIFCFGQTSCQGTWPCIYVDKNFSSIKLRYELSDL